MNTEYNTLFLFLYTLVSTYTVDWENFAELYYRVLNFSAFNFRHLASIYIVGIYSAKEVFERLIFATQATGEDF